MLSRFSGLEIHFPDDGVVVATGGDDTITLWIEHRVGNRTFVSRERCEAQSAFGVPERCGVVRTTGDHKGFIGAETAG